MATFPSSGPGICVACADGPIEYMARSEKTPSFESALGELEELVGRMESGKLSLEDSLAAYRRGAELVNICRKLLADAQQQVQVLEGDILKGLSVPAGDE